MSCTPTEQSITRHSVTCFLTKSPKKVFLINFGRSLMQYGISIVQLAYRAISSIANVSMQK